MLWELEKSRVLPLHNATGTWKNSELGLRLWYLEIFRSLPLSIGSGTEKILGSPAPSNTDRRLITDRSEVPAKFLFFSRLLLLRTVLISVYNRHTYEYGIIGLLSGAGRLPTPRCGAYQGIN